MSFFNFYCNQRDFDKVDDSVEVVINQGITDEKLLFDIFSKRLNMPSYFGRNWNALDDCLTDMSFLEEKNILFIHQDLPFKNNECTKRLYIETLYDTIRYWHEYPEHKFYVFFPEDCKVEVNAIVRMILDQEGG